MLEWKWCNFSNLGVTASGLSAHLIKHTFNLISVFSMHSAKWDSIVGAILKDVS